MKLPITSQLKSQLLTEIKEVGIERIVVGGVIKIADKFLLLQRTANDFMGGMTEIPSGKVDSNEDILNALKREVNEETGLTVNDINYYLGFFDYDSSKGIKTRQLNFLVSIEDSDTIKINPKEHQAYYLLGPDDQLFADLNISKNVRELLKKID